MRGKIILNLFTIFFSWFSMISLKSPIMNNALKREIPIHVNILHFLGTQQLNLHKKRSKTLLPSIMVLTSIKRSFIHKNLTGKSLEYIRAKHPLIPTRSTIRRLSKPKKTCKSWIKEHLFFISDNKRKLGKYLRHVFSSWRRASFPLAPWQFQVTVLIYEEDVGSWIPPDLHLSL